MSLPINQFTNLLYTNLSSQYLLRLVSLATLNAKNIILEFNERNNLQEEDTTTAAAHTNPKYNKVRPYKKGKGKFYYFAVNMVCRKHQVYFFFLPIRRDYSFMNLDQQLPTENHTRHINQPTRRSKHREKDKQAQQMK